MDLQNTREATTSARSEARGDVPRIFRGLDFVTEWLVFTVLIFSPWAFGTTENWSITTVNRLNFFQGNGVKGIIRVFSCATTGSTVINTTQDLIIPQLAHTAGTLNTNGKVTIDNTAQVHGQAINTQVASVSVTNMGSLLSQLEVLLPCGVATKKVLS